MSIIHTHPLFTTVRSGAAIALAVDSLVINDTNYPPATMLFEVGQASRIGLYWTASGGTIGVLDWLTIQLLTRGGPSGSYTWQEGPILPSVPERAMAYADVAPNTQFAARVMDLHCPSGTGLRIYAAAFLPLP